MRCLIVVSAAALGVPGLASGVARATPFMFVAAAVDPGDFSPDPVVSGIQTTSASAQLDSTLTGSQATSHFTQTGPSSFSGASAAQGVAIFSDSVTLTGGSGTAYPVFDPILAIVRRSEPLRMSAS
jgi:hypothetical protein